MAGEDSRGTGRPTRRGPLDWLIVAGTSAVFVGFAAVARVPALALDWGWAAALLLSLVAFLAAGRLARLRATPVRCTSPSPRKHRRGCSGPESTAPATRCASPLVT